MNDRVSSMAKIISTHLRDPSEFSEMERPSQERWIHILGGYVMIKINGKLVYEHRYLAEKALGKPLPEGAIVHHMFEPDDNIGPFKLVICPNQEYHTLLHRNMGHANNQYGNKKT